MRRCSPRRARSCSISSCCDKVKATFSTVRSRSGGAEQAARLLQAAGGSEHRAVVREEGGCAAPGASLDSATAIVFADPRISEWANRAIIAAIIVRPSVTMALRLTGRGASRLASPTAMRISVRASSFRMRPISTSSAASASARAALSARRWCRAWSIAARRAAASCRCGRWRPLANGSGIAGGGRRASARSCPRLIERALGAHPARPAGRGARGARTDQGRRGLGHGREAGLGAVRGAGRRRGLIVTRRADGAQCTEP